MDDPLEIALALGKALEGVGARWAVGGSVASSFHGIPRSTLDVDLIVGELQPNQTARLAELAGGFFMDDEALRREFLAGRSYNVFHEATMTKVDLFPAKGPFERNQLDRAIQVGGANVLSAEDTLLAKLRWFRLGGETSDRQWRDVAGIVALKRSNLDRAHLARWAVELGVADLVERALADDSAGV